MHRKVIVLVVDQTLVMVSRSQGRCPSASANPPQMSTTGSPPAYTATEAPTSVPASRLAANVAATPAYCSSHVPWMSATGHPLTRRLGGESATDRADRQGAPVPRPGTVGPVPGSR